MRPFRRIIAQTLVFLVIASCGGAAFSTDTVTVVFRDQPFVVRDPDTGAICYRLGFGNELWARRGMKNQSDVEIGKAICDTKLLYRSVCIMLKVNNPRQSTFKEATAAIERLKKIASQHASVDCKIEIVVFPRMPASQAE
jgi:hypothetical protein